MQTKRNRNLETKENETNGRTGEGYRNAGPNIPEGGRAALPDRRPSAKKGRRNAPALLSGLHADYSAGSTATLMTPSCRLSKSR